MDKKFGAAWHCAIGEGFGFEITYQAKNMIYVYYGTIGILAYKCWNIYSLLILFFLVINLNAIDKISEYSSNKCYKK